MFLCFFRISSNFSVDNCSNSSHLSASNGSWARSVAIRSRSFRNHSSFVNLARLMPFSVQAGGLRRPLARFFFPPRTSLRVPSTTCRQQKLDSRANARPMLTSILRRQSSSALALMMDRRSADQNERRNMTDLIFLNGVDQIPCNKSWWDLHSPRSPFRVGRVVS